jgi:hypothetical protein
MHIQKSCARFPADVGVSIDYQDTQISNSEIAIARGSDELVNGKQISNSA